VNLKYDELLSNIAFNLNLRPYTVDDYVKDGAVPVLGGAVQVDPGFSQLTPRLLSGTFRGFQLLKL